MSVEIELGWAKPNGDKVNAGFDQSSLAIEAKPLLIPLKGVPGKPTDHTVIPFGKGICGQVAVSNQNFMVPDVNAQDNYIACSIDVRSELVIPLFFEGKNIGQIDIDSNKIDPFSKEDELVSIWSDSLLMGIIVF